MPYFLLVVSKLDDYRNGMDLKKDNQSSVKSNQVTQKIIHCAMKVHSHLGPGLMESSYETCLEYELKAAGLHVSRQITLPIQYFDQAIEAGYRIDLMAENEIIIEIKAVEKIMPIHQAQLLTYLKLAKKTVGLLINFNVPHLRDSIKRFIRKQS